MKRAHGMPFGAEVLPGGGTRFRLWAPSARRIELVLDPDGAPRLHAMAPEPDGWYALTVPDAGDGTRYRYRVDGTLDVPDPASRCNPDDVDGPSMVVDPGAYEWQDGAWRGRPWHEAIVYELHVGTFTPAGSFSGLEAELDRLVDLGVTALELMPVAEFPGARNWGYDGVLLFAPDACYGTPRDLKRLIDAAHRRGLMVLLDVVYNHFGPQGNYLHAYAADFFTERHHTPWGAAVNFDGAGSHCVREFYLHNARYWLEEYHFDGLRFDAVHAIRDDSRPSILEELSASLRADYEGTRHVHLVLENDDNAARLLGPANVRPGRFDAQWNDDFHHCLHSLVTGETDGYYADYATHGADHRAQRLLARTLGEGFAYQGERSAHRAGRPRGEASTGLPPTAFVNFLQNHDQVGNRACGERLGMLASRRALRASIAVMLLAPQIPLLFMGEEWQAPEPFLYFCDFEPALAAAVRTGRRAEFASFERFGATATALQIPDPCAPATFERSRLDHRRATQAPHAGWLRWYRRLLALRREQIVPRLPGTRALAQEVSAEGVIRVQWRMGDGALLALTANLAERVAQGPAPRDASVIYVSDGRTDGSWREGRYPRWCVLWTLERADA